MTEMSPLRRRMIEETETSIGVYRNMTLAADHLLGSIVAPFTLRRVAFNRLGIDDYKRRTGLPSRLFSISHHQNVVNALQIAAVGQQTPIIVADAHQLVTVAHLRIPPDTILEGFPNDLSE